MRRTVRLLKHKNPSSPVPPSHPLGCIFKSAFLPHLQTGANTIPIIAFQAILAIALEVKIVVIE
jgi:hypothetical protein